MKLSGSKKIYGDITKSTVGRILAATLTFLKTLLLARLIVPDIYGEIAVIFSWGYIISSIIEVGSASSFIALESTSFPTVQLAGFWRIIRVKTGMSLLAIGIGSILFFTSQQLCSARILPALIFGLGLNLCHSPEFLLQAQKEFSRYAFFVVFVALLQLFWTWVAVYFYRIHFYNELVLFACLSLSTWFPTVVALLWIAKKYGYVGTHRLRSDFGYIVKILAFGKWIWMAGILAYLYQRWAVIILGNSDRTADAAAYDIALSFSQVINLLALSVVSVLSPHFASMTASSEAKVGLYRLVRFGLPFVFLSLGLYYLLGPSAVVYLFGQAYAISLIPLNVLMPSFLVTLVTEPIVTFVTFGLKQPKLVFWVSSVKAVVFLLVGQGLMQRYGLLGLAIFQSSARILEHLALSFYAFAKKG